MQMTKEQSAYRAYLLRLWQTKSGWRASLEHPHTGERLGFANLEQLFAFLKEKAVSHSEAKATSKDKVK